MSVSYPKNGANNPNYPPYFVYYNHNQVPVSTAKPRPQTPRGTGQNGGRDGNGARGRDGNRTRGGNGGRAGGRGPNGDRGNDGSRGRDNEDGKTQSQTPPEVATNDSGRSFEFSGSGKLTRNS